MSDSVSTETKVQNEILNLIIEHTKNLRVRYRNEAIRDLIEKGYKKKNRDIEVPPKYADKFDNQEGRIGFSVTKSTEVLVKNYAANHSIEYQKAYFEFVCCGLEYVNKKEPI